MGELLNGHTPAPRVVKKGRVGDRMNAPHTSLVLRGTQKLLERAKIRAELVGRGSMRVGELPDAHTCGR